MQQKIWVYALSNEVESDNLDKLKADILSFLENWDAHGAPVSAQLEISGNRLILISLTSENVIPSGCSKDKLDKSVREIGIKIGVPILDESKIILQREDSTLEVFERAELKQRLNSGELGINDLILDYSKLGNADTNCGNIFRPIKETWALGLINK